jgi:multicomponent Na+:H+ antiporter subunit F
MIAVVAAAGLVLALLLGLVRLFIGPTLYDRALAVKTLIIRAALVCGAMAVAAGESLWVDVALALALAGLVLMMAVTKVFRARTFQAPLAREDA